MGHHAYLFEAKSIQAYLLESGRLRDLIGGSELIQSLTEDLLDEVLRQVDPDQTILFSRKAGGAFYAFGQDPERIKSLMMLWSLVVQQLAPGLQFDHAEGSGDSALEAFDSARRALRGNTSFSVLMRPLAAPVTLRSQRTGLPAVAVDKRTGEPADTATRAKAASADLSKMQLMDRIGPEREELTWRNWPRSLGPGEEGGFPFIDEDRTIALVHADGNGFGELLRQAREAVGPDPERFMPVFKTLSNEIQQATEKAVQQAVAEVLVPNKDKAGILPARPVVVGGDDLTFLVRADLAVPFVQSFVAQFESASKRAMKKLNKVGLEGLPAKLTVGAGMVFMRASQPFHMALDLVEDLIGKAKDDARECGEGTPPSSVAFHRVTTSLVDDYDEVIARELTHRWGNDDFIHTMGTYAVGEPAQSLPDLDDLIELKRLLKSEAMARGPTRQLLGLIGFDPTQAKARYRRWREVMAGDAETRPLLDEFDRLLARLMQRDDEAKTSAPVLPYEDGEKGGRSPLGDVVALMAVAGRTTADTTEEGQAS